MSFRGISVPSAGGAFAKRSQVPPVSMPRSLFDLSKGHKTSLDSGLVVPLWVEEVLPGDTFKVKTTVLMRLATLLYPLMDNLYVDLHYFFCPWRLVWSNTEKFFGQQDNPADSVSYSIPQSTALLASNLMGIADYMGINTYTTAAWVVNTLQFRAYRRIWNEWYRDQNLQNSVSVPLGDGPDSLLGGFLDVLPRNKRGDYFTLCLPWPQKGTAVAMPFGGIATVNPTTLHAVPTFWGMTANASRGTLLASAGGAAGTVQAQLGGTAGEQMGWNNPNLVAAMSTLTGGPTINDFRQANAMQVYLERNARGGTRYPEYLKAQWGVTSSDARLQRTEYLGGGSSPVVVSPIAQMSASEVDNPLGKLGAAGTASHHGAGFVRSFEEHGYVFAMISVRADLNYQRGVPRQFKRRTLFDVANPAFAHIGEESVFNYEVWYDGEAGGGTPYGTFGFQERFASYKQSYSILSGNMRSQAAASYDVWHVAQEFGSPQVLGDTFIRENPAVDRVVATPFTDQWILDSLIDCKVARCLPLYGVPGLGGRF